MGKPYWGYENYLMGATVTARTASTVYPATNLSRYTMHRWRSDSKSAVLNGAKYFWVGDDPWNSITGNFHFEILAKPSLADTGGVPKYIINKWGVAGQKAYAVRQTDAKLQVLLSSDGTNTDALITFTGVIQAWIHKRFDINYNATAQGVALYINGVESGRVTIANATGTASIVGTVPASLFNGTTRLTIGSDHLGTDSWTGRLGLVGLQWASQDNGAWVKPSECIAYYSFDNSDGSDSSGNGHDLTPVNMTSGDYENYTAYQWVGFGLAAGKNPTYLFIDRRHNLSTGATVRVLEQSWFSAYSSLAYESSVTAGQPIVLTFSGAGSAYRWLEIHDPNNTDGYIEIPFIYMGTITSMQRAHLRGYSHEEPQPGNPDSDSFGNLTGHIIGGQIWAADLKFRCNATDFSTMQSIWDECARYRPVVFCEDVDYEGTKTRLVKVYPINYQHIYTTNQWVESKLREVAVGL